MFDSNMFDSVRTVDIPEARRDFLEQTGYCAARMAIVVDKKATPDEFQMTYWANDPIPTADFLIMNGQLLEVTNTILTYGGWELETVGGQIIRCCCTEDEIELDLAALTHLLTPPAFPEDYFHPEDHLSPGLLYGPDLEAIERRQEEEEMAAEKLARRPLGGVREEDYFAAMYEEPRW